MRALRVVIFEADLAYADALRGAFELRGCEVLLHHDGADATEFAQANAPELIILSVELPARNGFAICNQLKKLPELASVPLVLLSSHSAPESFEQHAKLRTRADDYVLKPTSAEELVQRCAALLAARQSRRDEPSSEPPRGALSGRDSDFASVTDAAFDDIMIDDGVAPTPGTDDVVMSEGLPPVPDDFEDFTTVSSVASLRLPPELRAPPGPPTRPPSMLAPAAVSKPPPPPPAAFGAAPRASNAELDAARAQVEALEAALAEAQQLAHDSVAQQARAERERDEAAAAQVALSRELDEARARVAAAPRSTGNTREFLELREALNRKDKELLSLRDALNQRDHEILELRDNVLQRDLARADLDDRVEETERTLRETQARLAATESAAAERAQSLETSLREAQERLATSEAALDAARTESSVSAAAHGAALAAVQGELADARARLTAADEAQQAARVEHAQALDALREEHARALAAEREASESATRAREAAHEEALAALSARLDGVERERAGLQESLEAARGEVDALTRRGTRRDAIADRARRAAEIAAALLDELADDGDSTPAPALDPSDERAAVLE